MNLSQDEINAMMAGKASAADPDDKDALPGSDSILDDIKFDMDSSEAWDKISGVDSEEEWVLTANEMDTLGEVGNMCMGAVATTMYTLLDRRVSITTPHVSVHTTREVLDDYKVPFVIVEVEYTEGIGGKNVLLLKEHDAALITDLLMGGDGHVEEPVELGELHMSAVNEIMNQMIGASATALSKVIQVPVNISPPRSDRISNNADVSEMLDYSQKVVKVSFDMEIENLLKSQLIQLMPFDVARNLAKRLMASYGITEPDNSPDAVPAEVPPVNSAPAPTPAPAPASAPAPAPAPAAMPTMPSYAMPEQPAPTPGSLVDVRPMQFDAFDEENKTTQASRKGIDLVYDIPLQVSVELGKTRKDISEILEFGMGTVVVLDKIAGDPVEILVNGKLIARGEVVVIDENYGVRITELFNN